MSLYSFAYFYLDLSSQNPVLKKSVGYENLCKMDLVNLLGHQDDSSRTSDNCYL